jgi:hypothetical protein
MWSACTAGLRTREPGCGIVIVATEWRYRNLPIARKPGGQLVRSGGKPGKVHLAYRCWKRWRPRAEDLATVTQA